MARNKTPVVIVRKDKKQHRILQAIGFAATGGASSVYTAPKAASNAAYNARTRKMQNEANAERPRSSDPLGNWLARRRETRALEATRAEPQWHPRKLSDQ
jgi:hypothetical protein